MSTVLTTLIPQQHDVYNKRQYFPSSSSYTLLKYTQKLRPNKKKIWIGRGMCNIPLIHIDTYIKMRFRILYSKRMMCDLSTPFSHLFALSITLEVTIVKKSKDLPPKITKLIIRTKGFNVYIPNIISYHEENTRTQNGT